MQQSLFLESILQKYSSGHKKSCANIFTAASTILFLLPQSPPDWATTSHLQNYGSLMHLVHLLPLLPFLPPAIYYSHLRQRAVNRSCHSPAQIFWWFPMQIPYQKPAYHSHRKSHPILPLGDAPTAGPAFPDPGKYVCSCIRTLALVVFCFLPQLFTRTIL